jgi:hypothetical protein
MSDLVGRNRELRDLLQSIDPKARDDLRRVLIHDQADRDAIAAQLLRYRDERGDGWADIIDMLTTYPEGRRRVGAAAGRDRSRRANVKKRAKTEGSFISALSRQPDR